MTQAELFTLLKTTGYPVSYHHFTAPPIPPYVVYLRAFDNNISSDYRVHGKFKFYQIELYTAKKDLVAEQKLEEVLNGINSEYDVLETYIDTEALYQLIYQIKVIEKF
jgi:predicted ABC-class ATPase